MKLLNTLVVLSLFGMWQFANGFPTDTLEDENAHIGAAKDVDIMALLEDTQPRSKRGQAPCASMPAGCCKDGKTPAPGPSKEEGCDMELCTDSRIDHCMKLRKSGSLNCASPKLADMCKYSCRKCRPAAPPIKACLKRRPAYGCCWDGKEALKPDGRDCIKCEDMYPQTCEAYSQVSGGCKSGSYGIRSFMIGFCPRTCGFCSLAAGHK